VVGLEGAPGWSVGQARGGLLGGSHDRRSFLSISED
jgi:hypothetical protein